jgi:ERCC4-type nuclease
MRVRVVVDVYEREGRVREGLRQLGVDTVVRRLAVADYEAGGALVERKSVRDLHDSIISGRFWLQVRRLRRVASRPYVLVEGTDLDAGPLRPESVRGALIALAELAIPLIRTSDPADSALWLNLLAARPSRKHHKTLSVPRPRANPAEEMLAAVPGMSIALARAMLNQFGTVSNIAIADPESWLSVPGIGPVRAQSLAKAFRQGERTA